MNMGKSIWIIDNHKQMSLNYCNINIINKNFLFINKNFSAKRTIKH